MGRPKRPLFFVALIFWGMFVASLVLYLCFPYQRLLKIALQNAIGGGRTTITMEGVKRRTLGIEATKLLVKFDGNGAQIAPFEISNINVFWNPLTLLTGKLVIDLRASLYEGSIRSTVDGIAFLGSSSPGILLTLKGVNMSRCPDGLFPWVKSVTGTLDGVIKREMAFSSPGKQGGSFRFAMRNGEIRDVQVKNLPRLIIPYQEIALEGKTDGIRINATKILLTSNVISLRGSGVIDPADMQQNLDISLSYEVFAKNYPLKGKGTISVKGNQAAPTVTISNMAADKEQPVRSGKI
jgi:type II secretion system protein N